MQNPQGFYQHPNNIPPSPSPSFLIMNNNHCLQSQIANMNKIINSSGPIVS